MVVEITSCIGNVVTVCFDSNTYYALFTDANEANLFTNELIATVNDFKVNGINKATRKKAIIANPANCTVSMNFNITNSTNKWEIVAKLSSVEEMNAFFKDVSFAIYGPTATI